MDRRYKYSFRKRIFFLFFLFCVFFLLLIWRLWVLQLKNGEKYTDAIRRQCIRTVRLAPIRGRIESKDGYIYVDNLPSFDLEFHISQFRRRRTNPLNSTLNYIEYQIKELSYFLNQNKQISHQAIKKVIEGKDKFLLFSFSAKNKLVIEGLFLDRSFFQVLEGANKVDIYILPSSKRLETHGQGTRTAQAIALVIQNIDDIIQRYPTVISQSLRRYLIKSKQSKLLEDLENERNFNLNVFQKHMRFVLFNYRQQRISKYMKRIPALPYVGLTNLNKEEVARMVEFQPPIAGVDLRLNAVRQYNNSKEIAHMIGYLQKEEFKKGKFDDFFYFQDEYYGRAGIEYKLDDILAGEGAMQLLQVDIAGFLKELITDPKYLKILQQRGQTKNGYNVTLTIDSNAQSIAYDLMKEHTGALVVIDCKNGEIKAMVSTPSYDLNTFRQQYSLLVNNKERPFSNRTSLAGYLPGSIVKPLIALAALKKYNINPLDTYNCEGEYKIAKNYKIRCAARYGHGEINLFEALEQSCNPFFIDLGVRCGIDAVRNIYEEFAIGQKPDLPLTQLQRGLLPGGKGWNKAETCYVSIGQGKVSMSPLQAALFVSIIANRGKVYNPHIIKKISDPYTGKDIINKEAELQRVVNIKEEYWDMIHHGMRRVVSGNNATARQAATEKGVKVAGKTGTVERRISEAEYKRLVKLGKSVKTKGRLFYTNDTWFVGFAPYDKPRYAIAVFIESGKSGGTTSAPIARKFLDLWLGQD